MLWDTARYGVVISKMRNPGSIFPKEQKGRPKGKRSISEPEKQILLMVNHGGTSSATALFFPWAGVLHGSLTCPEVPAPATSALRLGTTLCQRTTQTENARLDSG